MAGKSRGPAVERNQSVVDCRRIEHHAALVGTMIGQGPVGVGPRRLRHHLSGPRYPPRPMWRSRSITERSGNPKRRDGWPPRSTEIAYLAWGRQRFLALPSRDWECASGRAGLRFSRGMARPMSTAALEREMLRTTALSLVRMVRTTFLTTQGKDVSHTSAGKWLIEIAEMSSLSRRSGSPEGIHHAGHRAVPPSFSGPPWKPSNCVSAYSSARPSRRSIKDRTGGRRFQRRC